MTTIWILAAVLWVFTGLAGFGWVIEHSCPRAAIALPLVGAILSAICIPAAIFLSMAFG